MFHKNRCGFNLVESAIVLAVVGLVLGGIWIAAASFSQKNALNDHAKSLSLVLDGARRLFGSAGYPTTSNAQTRVTQALYRAGIFPGDWKLNAALAAVAPDGIRVDIYQANNGAYNTGSTTTNIGIEVVYYALTVSQCLNLVATLGGKFHDRSNLAAISANSVTITSFPASLTSAETVCIANMGNLIDYTIFWFRP